MKKINAILILLFLFTNYSFAQQEGTFVEVKKKCKVWWKTSLKENEKLKWKGKKENGFAQGEGILTYYINNKERKIYQGNIKNGKFHGFGKYTFDISNNYYYNGIWNEGLYNGNGTLNSAECIYKGNFNQGKKSGKGEISYKNDKIIKKYNGEFKNNLFNGQGEIWFINGEYYKGNFINSKIPERELYLKSIASNNLDSLELFLTQYPNHFYQKKILLKIKEQKYKKWYNKAEKELNTNSKLIPLIDTDKKIIGVRGDTILMTNRDSLYFYVYPNIVNKIKIYNSNKDFLVSPNCKLIAYLEWGKREKKNTYSNLIVFDIKTNTQLLTIKNIKDDAETELIFTDDSRFLLISSDWGYKTNIVYKINTDRWTYEKREVRDIGSLDYSNIPNTFSFWYGRHSLLNYKTNTTFDKEHKIYDKNIIKDSNRHGLPYKKSSQGRWNGKKYMEIPISVSCYLDDFIIYSFHNNSYGINYYIYDTSLNKGIYFFTTKFNIITNKFLINSYYGIIYDLNFINKHKEKLIKITQLKKLEITAQKEENEFYKKTEDGIVADCDRYLKKYPNGGYALRVQAKKQKLLDNEELAYFEKAKSGNKDNCNSYLSKYASGKYISEVKERILYLELKNLN